MKSLIATFAILAVAFASIAGFVLAQAPNNSPSTVPIAEGRDKATTNNQFDHPVLGKVLFEHVTTVHYCDATFPANSDGSFGGWHVGDEYGAQSTMTIYENYIVQEHLLPDGTVFRDSRPYDTLGRIEQRIPPSAPKPTNTN
ncbi:hypothetical protein Mal4_08950 [Maioricimonas rarisocia]|uniref:Uncharacterized protein n=1 Tax=Maioricimonas rarisocia TaxID=2528026 RepID=A0A517Z2B3_9PLAN|nr:hypothetical protein [Maioricimonas rarisocia]QDU36608.1 hypothetical protein Mal4_08950 [Maioricimonas rarisocia]